MPSCGDCGTDFSSGDKYCTECGKDVTNNDDAISGLDEGSPAESRNRDAQKIAAVAGILLILVGIAHIFSAGDAIFRSVTGGLLFILVGGFLILPLRKKLGNNTEYQSPVAIVILITFLGIGVASAVAPPLDDSAGIEPSTSEPEGGLTESPNGLPTETGTATSTFTPTPTTSPTDSPTPTPTKKEHLRNIAHDAVESGSFSEGVRNIEINGSKSTGFKVSIDYNFSLLYDRDEDEFDANYMAIQINREIYESGYNVSSTDIDAMVEVQDKYGNKRYDILHNVYFKQNTAEKVNWDNIHPDNIPEIADFYIFFDSYYN